MARYNFAFTALGQIIRNNKLVVPTYQRPYAWNEERARDFWEDIWSALEEREPEYFIGTVVLADESSTDARKQIIDGQQRIATATILLSAIRDLLESEGHTEASKAIQSDFIASFDLRRRELEPRLVLSNDDRAFFESYIVNGDVSTRPAEQRQSNVFIQMSREFFDAKLIELKAAHSRKWYERVTELSQFLATQLKVVQVSVPTEADAFTIFETLNDRGADLTVSDLLKNFLFGQAGTGGIELVRDNWVAAVGTLESIGQRGILVDFIRHLWSSRHGATREKDLYASIKRTIDTQRKTTDFSHELYQGAQIYAALYSSDHEYWKSRGSLTRANIQTLLRLELEQLRPLLVAVLRDMDDATINDVIRHLVSWSIRGLTVGGIGGGRTEKAYTEAAQKVSIGAIRNVDELRIALKDIIKTDEEFIYAMRRAEISNSKLARYMLLAMERTERSDAQPELVVNEKVEEVNLEHVLPKRARGGEWDQFSAGQKKAYTNRLGNLVLLRAADNNTIGNRPWSAKRPVLAASELKLTQMAGSHPDWTVERIDERQKKLASLAVKTWPI